MSEELTKNGRQSSPEEIEEERQLTGTKTEVDLATAPAYNNGKFQRSLDAMTPEQREATLTEMRANLAKLQPVEESYQKAPSPAWPIEKFAEEQAQALTSSWEYDEKTEAWESKPLAIPPKLLTEPGETVEQMIAKLDGDRNSRQYRLEQIKIRVKLASENRLTMPLTLYVNDVTFLLNQLGIELEKE